MENKIGELVVDWDDLDVGDKAIFEGYATDGFVPWKYTVGKVYTVDVDRVYDKGFIEDGAGSYSCPDRDFHRFKFRLISKANDTKQPVFPTFPFKLRNGDKPEVRQWLKDNGCKWGNGLGMFDFYAEENNLYVKDKKVFMSICEFDSEVNDEQEIELEIQPAVVTGYKLIENKSEKELKLEALVDKLQSELEKATTELNNL